MSAKSGITLPNITYNTNRQADKIIQTSGLWGFPTGQDAEL